MVHPASRSSLRRPRPTGFTLIEAMVALLVLSVGVIGVAALHGQSLAASRSAIFRSQAINLASDMAERIRVNPGARSAYAGRPADHGCDNPGGRGDVACTPAERAAHDLLDWRAEIAAKLPAGAGTVTVDASPNPAIYTVTVAWEDATAGGRTSFPLTFRLPGL